MSHHGTLDEMKRIQESKEYAQAVTFTGPVMFVYLALRAVLALEKIASELRVRL